MLLYGIYAYIYAGAVQAMLLCSLHLCTHLGSGVAALRPAQHQPAALLQHGVLLLKAKQGGLLDHLHQGLQRETHETGFGRQHIRQGLKGPHTS